MQHPTLVFFSCAAAIQPGRASPSLVLQQMPCIAVGEQLHTHPLPALHYLETTSPLFNLFPHSKLVVAIHLRSSVSPTHTPIMFKGGKVRLVPGVHVVLSTEVYLFIVEKILMQMELIKGQCIIYFLSRRVHITGLWLCSRSLMAYSISPIEKTKYLQQWSSQASM